MKKENLNNHQHANVQKKKSLLKGVLTMFCLLLLIGMIPSQKVSAASKKKTAMKAYASFLAKHPSKTFSRFGDASFSNPNKSYVNSYFLFDIDKNGVPELFTYTNVNFRWTIVRVYSFKNGKVKLCKLSNKNNAEFNNNASANGSYNFYICKKNHIHNAYSGGMEQNAFVYKGVSNKLKEIYTCREVNMFPRFQQATKNGKRITMQKYQSETKNCRAKNLTKYNNNSKSRSTLKKGKAKINR